MLLQNYKEWYIIANLQREKWNFKISNCKLLLETKTVCSRKQNYCSRFYQNQRKKIFDNVNRSFIWDNKLLENREIHWPISCHFIWFSHVFTGYRKRSVAWNVLHIIARDVDKLEKCGKYFHVLFVSVTIKSQKNRMFFKSNINDFGCQEQLFYYKQWNRNYFRRAVNNYKFHPSILQAKKKSVFSFKQCPLFDIEKDGRDIIP